MARLIAPNGSTVNVADEKVERLLGQGYRSAEEKRPKSTRAKKAASSDESEK